MNYKRFKPKVDKYFWTIWIPLMIILSCGTILSFKEIVAFVIFLFVDLICLYFMLSSLSGYAELREKALFIKFGFLLKRNIPYDKIKEVTKERKVMTYSMLSLKNALEHINIKYNKFDMVTVSVVNNDELLNELNKVMNK